MRRTRWRGLALGLSLSVLLTACPAHIRGVREAQDAFDRAATEEGRLTAAGLGTETGLLTQSSSTAEYRVALALLSREIDRHQRQLRGDRLLGTALVLKALCLWRLADLEATDETGWGEELAATLTRIERDDSLVLGERDRVLVAALPGLRDHDRGLRAADYESASRLFASALEIVGRAAESAPPLHPVRTYLRLAQLATCRAWQSAAYAFFPDDLNRADDEADKPLAKAREILTELEQQATRDAALQAQITSLRQRLGL